MTAWTWSPADEILQDAVADCLATIRFGRLISRTIPTAAIAARLQVGADEAAEFMPTEPQHLGAVWELAS